MIEKELIPSTDASSNITADFDLGDTRHFSVQAIFTGSDVAGTFKIQASNYKNSNFEDVSGASVSVTSSDDLLLNLTDQNYRYLRLSWTYSSGTGNIKAKILGKGRERLRGLK